MEEYDFTEEIKDKYKVEELNSKTLDYRINGFIKACNMDLSKSVCSKEITTHHLEYSKLEYNNQDNTDNNYSVKFFKDTNDKGNYISISGNYNDLDFRFINYVDNDNNYNKIYELPFSVLLKKEKDIFNYDLEIVTLSKYNTKFILRKNNEKMLIPSIITFKANILDFGIILRLIKSFVNDPEQIFDEYNKTFKQKECTFNNKDITKSIIKDDTLEEPVKGLKKVIRNLFK